MKVMERSIVLFPRLNGLLRKSIHHKLVVVLEENVISYSSATKLCREAILGVNSEAISSSPKDDSRDEFNETILLVLSNEPFLLDGRLSVGHVFQKAPYIVGLSFLCIFHSDIPIWFRTNSQTVGRQIESCCRATFVTSCHSSGIKDEDLCSSLLSYEIMVVVIDKS
jgi:hypothetical protein